VGALSASLVYVTTRRYFFPQSSHLNLNDRKEDDDNSDDNKSNTTDTDDYTHIDANTSGKWPWDKIRRRISIINASVSFLNLGIMQNYLEEDDDDISSANNSTDKTGPCIGEIFGLDVGGTLTKLVYFEQQIREYKRQSSHEEGMHRHEHYNVAASALEVLQVRRSADDDTLHSSDSDTDLQGLWGLRQESVPDRLNEYQSSCDIDIGAPLTPKRRERGLSEGQDTNGHNNNNNINHEQQPETSGLSGGMKRSKSMVTLSKSTKEEALDNFYSFARRLDTYETAKKDHYLSYYSRFLNGTFHFIRFETRRMNHAMNLMRLNNFHKNIKQIGATGGGAHKFASEWEKGLGITMAKQSEMDSLVAGMQFVMQDIVGECYTFKPSDWSPESSKKAEHDDMHVNGSLRTTPLNNVTQVSAPENDQDSIPDMSPDGGGSNHQSELSLDASSETLNRVDSTSSEAKSKPRVDQWWTSKKVQRDNVTASDLYPYLLVSIGTGVSILRVDGPRQHERISGSTIGGGTYWGLCRLLTGSDSFSDVLDLAMKGDPSKVDMMVGDIYGKNSKALEKVGLGADIVASSFGKLVAKQNPSEGIKEEDLARALLLMVTNNIGQVAHLNAKLYKTQKIYFVGTFLQHNTISQQRLAYSIDYWSQGKMEAQFLEHEVSIMVCFVSCYVAIPSIHATDYSLYSIRVILEPLGRFC